MTQTRLFALTDDHPLVQDTPDVYQGLILADTQNATLRLYDSFDWRLYRAGLCLQEWNFQSSTTPYTETHLLDNDGNLQQQLAKPVTEAGPDDALMQSIQTTLAPRALLPQAEFSATQQRHDLRNEDGKLLARCNVIRYTANATDERLNVLALDSLRGYEKAAERLLAHLKTSGTLQACQNPSADLYRLAAVEPNSYSVKPRLKLMPEQPAHAALRQVFEWLLDAMIENEPGLRQDLDSEFLHDFRIAVRRTRSLLGAFKTLFPTAATQQFRTEFSWLGQITGPTRDLDVYLLKLPAFQQELPTALQDSLGPLHDYLQSQQKREHQRLVRALDSARYRKLKDAWRDFLSQAPEQTTPQLHEAAGKRIWKAYRQARKQGLAITPANPAEDLHELRKTCKKLRYLLDGLPGLYPADELAAALKPLKALQNLLGDFQDCSVQAAHLEHYAQALRKNAKVPVETFMALGVLVDHLERRSHELRAHFAQEFADFANRSSKRQFRALTQ